MENTKVQNPEQTEKSEDRSQQARLPEPVKSQSQKLREAQEREQTLAREDQRQAEELEATGQVENRVDEGTENQTADDDTEKVNTDKIAGAAEEAAGKLIDELFAGDVSKMLPVAIGAITGIAEGIVESHEETLKAQKAIAETQQAILGCIQDISESIKLIARSYRGLSTENMHGLN